MHRRCLPARHARAAASLGPRRCLSANQQLQQRQPAAGNSSPPESDEGAQITVIGALVNGSAALLKAAAGVASSSPSLIADAGHSLSDLLSDGVTLWALAQSKKPACSTHPYGRGKYEAVGASVTAAMITSTGLGVGFHAVSGLSEALSGLPPVEPTAMAGAAAAAIAGVLAKEALYRETLRIGLATRSPALLANAWHHRSDALSSVVALVGIGGTACGLPVLDSIGGVVVAGMVTKVGLEMGLDNFGQLTDASVEEDVLQRISSLAADDADVRGVASVRCRRLGPYLHAELRLQVAFGLSVSAAQQIATKAKLRVLQQMADVAEVTVSLDAEAPLLDGAPGYGGSLVVGRQVVDQIGQLMRSPAEIEADVRAAMVRWSQLPRQTRVEAAGATAGDQLTRATARQALWGLSHTLVHWRSRDACSGAIVEASLVLDPETRLRDAHGLARDLREVVLRAVPDVHEIDLHLELFDGSDRCPASVGAVQAAEELPPHFRLEPRSELHQEVCDTCTARLSHQRSRAVYESPS